MYSRRSVRERDVVTVIQVVFFLISALILGAGLLTVTVRNLVHAALWLIAGFFGVGALYLLMQAEFAAVVQVLIYVGAIAVLILFAIMLTPNVEATGNAPIFRRRWPVLVVASALFGLLIIPTMLTHQWALANAVDTESGAIAGVREIGTAFLREYLLPFELASVLLLTALVGAIIIGFDEESRRRVLTLAEELRLSGVRSQESGVRGQTSELPGTDGPEIDHEGHEVHEDGDLLATSDDTPEDSQIDTSPATVHRPDAQQPATSDAPEGGQADTSPATVHRPSSTVRGPDDPPTETRQGEKQDG
jgi:NADH-quinone oxidoreductase subunit J